MDCGSGICSLGGDIFLCTSLPVLVDGCALYSGTRVVLVTEMLDVVGRTIISKGMDFLVTIRSICGSRINLTNGVIFCFNRLAKSSVRESHIMRTTGEIVANVIFFCVPFRFLFLGRPTD